jgi:hypothetical protein
MTFCASLWFPQKVGLAIVFSISASWSSRLAFSKMPPQFRAAPLQVVVSIFVISQVDSH